MPVQQDACRLKGQGCWGYDPISLFAVDSALGTPAELVDFLEEAHRQKLAVIIDFVANHLFFGSESLLGHWFFRQGQDTEWGPRPDYSKSQVCSYVLAAAEFYCTGLGFDGIRVDSTKSIRKFPGGDMDPHGTLLLGQLTAMCRRHGKLAIAEDLEDGEGRLLTGGLGFHMQWDMSLFCDLYKALVQPDDNYRGLDRVNAGLGGLYPARGHPLGGRVIFTESHDTAASDRYGRIPAAVHHGKAFMQEDGEGGGDAFQQAAVLHGCVYPTCGEVESNRFAARRTALGLVVVMTAPGVPMLLQGQEVGECRPYQWPAGPVINSPQVGLPRHGEASRYYQFSRELLSLRLSGNGVGPLAGDGLHVFHEHGGILAYLRWAETTSSTEPLGKDSSQIALVVTNWSCNDYPSYEIGVPPSQMWSLALSTEAQDAIGDCHATAAPGKRIPVLVGKPNHGFPSSIDLSLRAYSGVILFQQS